jgi:hypothetical protein
MELSNGIEQMNRQEGDVVTMQLMSRKVKYLAAVGLLLLFMTSEGCALTLGGPSRQTTSISVASISASAPTLGGSEAAFTAKFGQPEPQYIYTFRTQTAERVILYLGLLHLFTTGQIRVQTIVVQRSHQDEWDAATARAIYQPFFPPDAQLIRDEVSPNGTHHLYKSLLLANTFPPGAFVDTHGKQLAPGTFDVLCNTTLVTHVGGSYGCGLTIGEWPLT